LTVALFETCSILCDYQANTHEQVYANSHFIERTYCGEQLDAARASP
jgi:hypothetical protein